MNRSSAVLTVLALYPTSVAVLLVILVVLQPRDGPLALASILSMHLTLAAVILVPFALPRAGRILRIALVVLAAIGLTRFGGELVSPPTPGYESLDGISVLSWNLEFGARKGAAAVTGLAEVATDVIVIQELGPEHSAAIAADRGLRERYPYRWLFPRPGTAGIGLLSAFPVHGIQRADDPIVLEAVIELPDAWVTVVTAHPYPGRISMVGGLPVGFQGSIRDAGLRRIHERVDEAIRRGDTVVVAGDFNVSPTEPGYAELGRGLADAHVAAGQGTGWTWRPSSLEGLGIGLLRIDLAFAGPGLRPVATAEHCSLPGDHCQLEAHFAFE